MVTFPQIGRFTSHTPLKIHSKRLTNTRLQSAIYNLITQLDLGLQKIAADLFFAVATSAEKFCYKQGLQVPKLSPYISPCLEPIYILDLVFKTSTWELGYSPDILADPMTYTELINSVSYTCAMSQT
jgi:hypothetical protein